MLELLFAAQAMSNAASAEDEARKTRSAVERVAEALRREADRISTLPPEARPDMVALLHEIATALHPEPLPSAPQPPVTARDAVQSLAGVIGMLGGAAVFSWISGLALSGATESTRWAVLAGGLLALTVAAVIGYFAFRRPG